ncbi:MAG TPA: hypothetical protein VGG72_09635 [Bryobacteraceae bacterium]|jgi:hypothetical protein
MNQPKLTAERLGRKALVDGSPLRAEIQEIRKADTDDAIVLAKRKADELKKSAGDTIGRGKRAIVTPWANPRSAVEAGKKA